MGIFNTALQTLSEVAIQESGVSIPKTTKDNLLEEFMGTLSQFPELDAEDMVFDVRMVPVRESARLGKYLIEMEDLSRYMITNKISSIKEAVANILESNDLQGQYANTALVIDESSILNELDQLGINIPGNYPEPKPGLGKTLFGDQDALKYIRRLANTKQVIDTLCNTYGLQVVKKNYQQEGFLEDAKLKEDPDDEVLHEKDNKKKKHCNNCNNCDDCDCNDDEDDNDEELSETSLSQYKPALAANQQKPGSFHFVPPGGANSTNGNTSSTSNIVPNGGTSGVHLNTSSTPTTSSSSSSTPSTPTSSSSVSTTPSSTTTSSSSTSSRFSTIPTASSSTSTNNSGSMNNSFSTGSTSSSSNPSQSSSSSMKESARIQYIKDVLAGKYDN